jgi:hypothetical protein
VASLLIDDGAQAFLSLLLVQYVQRSRTLNLVGLQLRANNVRAFLPGFRDVSSGVVVRFLFKADIITLLAVDSLNTSWLIDRFKFYVVVKQWGIRIDCVVAFPLKAYYLGK